MVNNSPPSASYKSRIVNAFEKQKTRGPIMQSIKKQGSIKLYFILVDWKMQDKKEPGENLN